MRIDLRIRIGTSHPCGLATKTIELEFAPTLEMTYNDGTWKGAEGRKIIDISIECPLDETRPYLAVALTRDESGTLDQLKGTYESWGWKVLG